MVKNTLNVGSISEGFVLDHIEAGRSMDIYKYLHLDKLDCCVAIIKNAKSNKMGKKDIIKIECPIDFMDLDILGFIDHNITINIIENEKIVEKKQLRLPKEIRNVIRCKNPRCITSIEQGLDHVFVLTDEENQIYRCKYCEEKYRRAVIPTKPNKITFSTPYFSAILLQFLTTFHSACSIQKYMMDFHNKHCCYNHQFSH